MPAPRAGTDGPGARLTASAEASISIAPSRFGFRTTTALRSNNVVYLPFVATGRRVATIWNELVGFTHSPGVTIRENDRS